MIASVEICLFSFVSVVWLFCLICDWRKLPALASSNFICSKMNFCRRKYKCNACLILIIMNLGSWSFLHSIKVSPEHWEIFNRWGQLFSYWTLSVLKGNVNLYWGFYRSCLEYFLTENEQSWYIQQVNEYTVSGSRKKWTCLILCTWYNVPHLSITF